MAEGAGAQQARRPLALVAAAAIATTAVCGAVAGAGIGVGTLDVPVVLLAALLAVGVGGVAARRSLRVLPPGKDVAVLTAVTAAGFLVLYLAGWTDRSHQTEIARLLPLGVVGLAVLWPEPNVLRYSLLLAVGTLIGAAGEPIGPTLAVGGALVSAAVALVATNRLTAAAAPAMTPPIARRAPATGPRQGRAVATEAGIVLVVVGLLAALAASLLPPPPSPGGGGGRGRANPSPAAPPVQFGARLDVGAGRSAPGDDIVFVVDAAEPDTWRAVTYDRWDGQSWTRPDDRARLIDESHVIPGAGDVAGENAARRSRQSVSVLAQSTDVLIAAARAADVVASAGGVRQGADGSLFPLTPLTRGQRYVVTSDISQATGDVLRALGDTAANGIPTDVADDYLQLPQVDPRVRALAADIAGRRTTTYSRVRAVESWIRSRVAITDDAVSSPAGVDLLSAFLFDDRSGPPERAATAMAVMLRSLGIPARMAAGYLPGTRTGSDQPFFVRSDDRHAWVEVWFPTVGWQRFDPTGRAPDAHSTESVWDRLQRFLTRLWPLVVLAVLVAVGWLIWTLTRWHRRRSARPWATRMADRMEKAGAARGRPRRPEETPKEYASSLAGGVLADPRLVEVGELVTVGAWSRHEPSAEERGGAEAVLRAAIKAAPARRLRRMTTRRRPRPTRGPRIRTP